MKKLALTLGIGSILMLVFMAFRNSDKPHISELEAPIATASREQIPVTPPFKADGEQYTLVVLQNEGVPAHEQIKEASDIEDVLPLPDILKADKVLMTTFVAKMAEVRNGLKVSLPHIPSETGWATNDAKVLIEARTSRNRLLEMAKSAPVALIDEARAMLATLEPEKRAAANTWSDEYQTRSQFLAKGLSTKEIDRLLAR